MPIARSTFSVRDFKPTDLTPIPPIVTGLPVTIVTMEKVYTGEVTGRSATLFTTAFNPQSGIGTYIAMESFEGVLDGKNGTFNFIHSAATSGNDRTGEFFAIVEGSGTGDLTSIRGFGSINLEPDGTHTIMFDYQL